MPRFNAPARAQARTTNLAGGEAFHEDPKVELASMLLTSMVQNQFYRSEGAGVERLRELLDQVDPLFAAKASVYARLDFGLRSIAHVTAAELALRVRGERWTRPYYRTVMIRPDDVTETLAYLFSAHGLKGSTIPNALRDGAAQAFEKWDAYQLGKYRMEGKSVSLVDAVNMLHPRPINRNSEALAALVKGELRQTGTWENTLSAAGEEETEEEVSAAKEATWVELLAERKIGYFALLRNLRNIAEHAPEQMPAAAAMLTDARMIHNSKVLPFRYLSAKLALEEMPGARVLADAVVEAADIAVDNVPKFEGRTLVVLDESGSMTGTYPYRSMLRASGQNTSGLPTPPIVTGALLAAALYRSNDADLMLFCDSARYVNVSGHVPVLTLADEMIANARSRGTDFKPIFRTARAAYDRVIILSDMQGWMNWHAPTAELAEYEAKFGVRPFVYSLDLAGYGTLQFPQARVFAIAGFSEKLFDVMRLLEEDRQALINRIEAVEFR